MKTALCCSLCMPASGDRMAPLWTWGLVTVHLKKCAFHGNRRREMSDCLQVTAAQGAWWKSFRARQQKFPASGVIMTNGRGRSSDVLVEAQERRLKNQYKHQFLLADMEVNITWFPQQKPHGILQLKFGLLQKILTKEGSCLFLWQDILQVGQFLQSPTCRLINSVSL